MGRPGEAVDAAMLAAAIGIDRAIEADVRRLIAADDRLRVLHHHRGAERRRIVQLPSRVQPVAVRLAGRQVEAVRGAIFGRAPAGAGVGPWHVNAIAVILEHNKNSLCGMKWESSFEWRYANSA